jgi:MmoB/DmpM family
VTAPSRAYEVAIALMKSPEADATVAVVTEADPDAEVIDRGPYLHLRSPHDITVDLNAVADELGEDVPLSRWLVVMSTYTGRIVTGDDFITFTAELPD